MAVILPGFKGWLISRSKSPSLFSQTSCSTNSSAYVLAAVVRHAACRRRPPAAHQHLGRQPAGAGVGTRHGRDPAAPHDAQAQPHPAGSDSTPAAPPCGPPPSRPSRSWRSCATRLRASCARGDDGGLCAHRRPGAGAAAQPPGLRLHLQVEDGLTDLCRPPRRPRAALWPPARQRLGRPAHWPAARGRLCSTQLPLRAIPHPVGRRRLAGGRFTALQDGTDTPRRVQVRSAAGPRELMIQPRYTSNNQLSLQQLCEAGYGLRCWATKTWPRPWRPGRLLRYKPTSTCLSCPSWALAPQRDTQPAKVRHRRGGAQELPQWGGGMSTGSRAWSASGMPTRAMASSPWPPRARRLCPRPRLYLRPHRPYVGEAVSFEIGLDGQGRRRAQKVRGTAPPPAPQPAPGSGLRPARLQPHLAADPALRRLGARD